MGRECTIARRTRNKETHRRHGGQIANVVEKESANRGHCHDNHHDWRLGGELRRRVSIQFDVRGDREPCTATIGKSFREDIAGHGESDDKNTWMHDAQRTRGGGHVLTRSSGELTPQLHPRAHNGRCIASSVRPDMPERRERER